MSIPIKSVTSALMRSFESSAPLIVSIPHSNEDVPEDAYWLKDCSNSVLLRDVDRFVDWLYEPALKSLGIAPVLAFCHRYVVDLNRFKSDLDSSIVEGVPPTLVSASQITQSKASPKLLHWKATTLAEPLMNQPISLKLHRTLMYKYYVPFFQKLQECFDFYKKVLKCSQVYHLDLHSMPSVGRAFHGDMGQKRSDVVISDYHGTSSNEKFVNLVIQAYKQQDLKVAHNTPYVGGGITRYFGRPLRRQNTVQVELNRSLYMDEFSYELKNDLSADLQVKLKAALEIIFKGIHNIL